MVEPQSSVFWQTALKSGLVKPRSLEACWESVPPEKRTADSVDRRLARQVVNAGHLTLWQAQQLLSGRHAGLRIDRYVLQDLLGVGGMGRVYLALDSKLNRPVALKILSRERMNNPRALARFRREAKVGAQLQHENLIRVYDEGESSGVRYLVMEYINGQTVAQIISEQGRLPYPMAAKLARQVALGLAHLHQKGLLHRDINPMNILVDRNGTAKLTDLGLAIDLDDLDDVVTRDGATVGTFDYISPEQARHSRQIDTRSDIYSLGCTIYHMITGRVPFPAPSLPEKLFAHQSSDPDPLPSIIDDVPEELDAVVRRMMSKKPEDRYENPTLLVKALEPFILGADERPVPARARESLVAAVASESPTVVEHGAASETSASDPDLATAPIESPSGTSPFTPITPNSDRSDFFKLDLGPAPRLSDTLSVDGDGGTDEEHTSVPWTWFGAAALVVLVLAYSIAAYMLGSASPPDSGPGTGNEPGGTPSIAGADSPTEPRAEITVEYKDGTIFNAATLSDAISLAAGKAAEVVLRNKEPLHLEIDKPHRVSRGDLKIRAAKGATPVIGVAFKKSATWLLAAADTRIQISGISFELIRLDQSADNPPTLMELGGNVELDRCSFEAGSGSQNLRVLKAEGRHTRLTGCWFEGFDNPLEQSLFPGGDVQIEQTVFVRTLEGDSAQGWPLFVRSMGVNRKGVARVAINHVTASGAGLLRAEGFSTNLPLQVDVGQSVISTHAVLMWGGTFPEGLTWTGQGNIYEVSGAAWVVQPPNGFNAIEGSPSSLESWIQGPIKEEDARVLDVQFANESPAENHKPADFVLMNVDEPKPGADPKAVGPIGTAEK